MAEQNLEQVTVNTPEGEFTFNLGEIYSDGEGTLVVPVEEGLYAFGSGRLIGYDNPHVAYPLILAFDFEGNAKIDRLPYPTGNAFDDRGQE